MVPPADATTLPIFFPASPERSTSHLQVPSDSITIPFSEPTAIFRELILAPLSLGPIARFTSYSLRFADDPFAGEVVEQLATVAADNNRFAGLEAHTFIARNHVR